MNVPDDNPLRLVYQPVPAEAGDRAFTAALQEVIADSEELLVVSPYVSHELLQPLFEAHRVRLITDEVELAKSGCTPQLRALLQQYSTAARSVRGVHAKVIIGSTRALLGSANLTRTGFSRRYEMSALITGRPIEELRRWFEDLWSEGSPLRHEYLETHTAEPTPRQDPPGTPALPSTGSIGAARTASSNHIAELATVLHRFTETPHQARRILDLYAEALQVIDLPLDSNQLHMNFRSHSGPSLSITVGNRYVIWLCRQRQPRSIGFCLDDPELANDLHDNYPDLYVSAFTRNGAPDVPTLRWPIHNLDNIPPELIASWHRAIQTEVDRGYRSAYLASKRPELSSMLSDPELRAAVVRTAYPDLEVAPA